MDNASLDVGGNKEIVAEFFNVANTQGLSSAISSISADAIWWSAGTARKRDEMAALLDGLSQFCETPIVIYTGSITAEADRVAVEAFSKSKLKNGRDYHNIYCFVFRLSAGQIIEIREYCDTQHAADVFGAG